MFELLASSGLQHILHSNGWASTLGHDEEEDEEEDDDDYDDGYISAFRHRLRARRGRGTDQFPKVPSDAGTQLMKDGDFGTDDYYIDRLKQRKKILATSLMWRELGIDPHGVRKRADQAISQVSTVINDDSMIIALANDNLTFLLD